MEGDISLKYSKKSNHVSFSSTELDSSDFSDEQDSSTFSPNVFHLQRRGIESSHNSGLNVRPTYNNGIKKERETHYQTKNDQEGQEA